MRTLKMIADSLRSIANSLVMIEITLLKIHDLKYSDIEGYAKDYNESSETVSSTLRKYDV